ncbi:hypothetical protein [Spirillospora sp. CA-294931]|uniref:hypothetical protein n=1 Tax=Spirillospora sp. CA-294931 TaxID=3240042 RepID=UPI003D9096F7
MAGVFGGGPGSSRLEGLLSLFERIRERPTRRAGDRLRPLLITIGSPDETREAAHEFVERCMADPGPYTHISADGASAGDAFSDQALLLRHMSRDLSAHRRRFEPGLRFPLLSMALWLLELRRMRLDQQRNGDGHAPASAAQQQTWQLAAELRNAIDDAQSRALLGRGIRRRRQIVVPAERPGQQGRFASALSHLEQVAPIGVATIALVSAGAAATLDLAAAIIAAAIGLSVIATQVATRTRDWAGRRRYRWFTSDEQRHLRGLRSTDFLGFALDVISRPEAAPDRPLDEQLERVLVAAFLQDLRHSYRRSIWRAPWARVRYPAAVFDQLPPGSPGRAQCRLFAERVEELRRDEERFDPLVIVFAVGSRPEARELALAIRTPPADQPVADLTDVRESEHGHAFWNAHLAQQRRVAVLGTRREFRVDSGTGNGSSTEEVYRGRRRPLLTHPSVPWIVATLILAASVAVISFQAVRYCAAFSVWRAGNGECVGITDGSYAYTGRLRAAERRIKRLNDEVTGSGKPYVTLVYLGPMTTDPETKNPVADLMAGVHGELIGLSIAQQRHNAASGQPLLRILLANTGSRFRYAAEVAARIRERAAEDRTIVAVAGFGHSRRQTGEAIDELAKSAMPMIGTTNTYDGTGRRKGGFSPYYFRLAPPNSRLADHAAFWAKNGLTGPRAKTADVFYDADKDDFYSKNLAEDFARSFGKDRVRMLPYADPSQVPSRVQEACVRPSEMFYYAGRSDEFRSFINRLATTSCGGRRVVVAGDEVTKYVSDNGPEIGRTSSIRLFYSPIAAREAWTERWAGRQPVPVFYGDFDVVVGEIYGKGSAVRTRPSRTHAAIGYDAAVTVISVAERIYGEQGRALPTAAAILSELTEPRPGALDQGASGLLRFGSRTRGHQIDDKPVLLAEVLPDGRHSIVAVCGPLVRAEGGPRAPVPCPGR